MDGQLRQEAVTYAAVYGVLFCLVSPLPNVVPSPPTFLPSHCSLSVGARCQLCRMFRCVTSRGNRVAAHTCGCPAGNPFQPFHAIPSGRKDNVTHTPYTLPTEPPCRGGTRALFGPVGVCACVPRATPAAHVQDGMMDCSCLSSYNGSVHCSTVASHDVMTRLPSGFRHTARTSRCTATHARRGRVTCKPCHPTATRRLICWPPCSVGCSIRMLWWRPIVLFFTALADTSIQSRRNPNDGAT